MNGSVASLVLFLSLPSATAATVAPEEWAKLALGRCLAMKEDRDEKLERLAARLAREGRSEEEHRFVEQERAAHRKSLEAQQKTYFDRLDYLLLGEKARLLARPAERFRRAVDAQRAQEKSAFRDALALLFADATPCELDALEATLVFAIFDLPFTRDSIEDGLDTDFVFGALEHAYHHRFEDEGTLERVYASLRPADPSAVFRYVDEMTARLAGIASEHVAQARERVSTAQQIVTREELQEQLATALENPEASPLDARFPESRPELSELAERFAEFVRLSAEPARIRIYLHAKVEEVESQLRYHITDEPYERLLSRVEKELYDRPTGLVRLAAAPPERTLSVLAPILDRWFRREALPSVQKELYDDPFAAYWFYVQTGIAARKPHAYRGSKLVVSPDTFDLGGVAGLDLTPAMQRLQAARVPSSFIDAQVELEADLTAVSLTPEEALERIAEADLSERDREKLRRFATLPGENDTITTTDVYSWVVRDASKITGAADWDLARAALELLLEAKREKLAERARFLRGAEDDGGTEGRRLASYLEMSGELLLELELHQATERRFQEATGGAFVGWLLSRFLISGGVPGELWVPGGVTGPEFAELLDELTPKNRESGNPYLGKPADRIRLVHDGREYHETFVAIIDRARNFLNLASFDWKTDQGGKDITYRLMAKKLGIEGDGYDRFLDAFSNGLPLSPESEAPTLFYDVPVARMKNVLLFHFFRTSTHPEIRELRGRLESFLGAELPCPSVATCGDLAALRAMAGTRFDPDRSSDPAHRESWEIYRAIQNLFEAEPVELRHVRPRRDLADYARQGDDLRRFIRRYGRRREDDPSQPFPIHIVGDGKQNLFNLHFGQPSDQFPYFFTDPVRDVYLPLYEFDVRMVLWKGVLEFPWNLGPVPIPGRRIKGVVPMPFIPYPWLGAVPGFGWAGPATSLFLQYLLAADARAWWAMVTHTKNVSNESMAMESGMGVGSKYFNGFEDFGTWHDMGVLVEGPIVGDVNDHFVQTFNQARVNNRGIPGARGVAIPKLSYAPFAYQESGEAGGSSENRSWLLTTHPEEGDYNYRGVFMAALAAARKNIFVENAFFSDPLVARMLVRKAREFRSRVSCAGLSALACAEEKRAAVDIHLVLPDTSDKPIIDAVGTADFHEMLHLGVKIYRWNPARGWSARKMLHTKAWLIDYEEGQPGLAYVGSANATQRSHLTDNEAGIVSISPDFAREVYERLFLPDTTADSRMESAENFHVVWSTNPVVRASRRLRSLLVSLFWFI